MLDTYGRKIANPFIEFIANKFIKINLSANEITILAVIIGLLVGALIYFEYNILAVITLWLSGLLDAVDGTVARKQSNSTAWGTLMDITFDRIVELTVIISIALKFPESRLSLIILSSSIIISMTVFLTVGALSEKKGIKSFYYQAGIAERTEGFILFSLMILFSNKSIIITYIFAILVIITAIQRMMEARKIFL